ncbi:MAG: hypothetical protein KDC18_15710 [Alphaproteobacteria bacterium]|nr:hypothetical protein [Alphaproteobacteria bacterium]MCB9928881.1 hypothetical protein [Alphaproteobacteria bacterium]
MQSSLFALTLIGFFASAAGPAGASAAAATATVTVPCGPRPEVVAQLAGRHDERQVAFGLARSGQVMELWAGPAGGWTLLATLPSGLTCLVAVGERLDVRPPPAAPPADPA